MKWKIQTVLSIFLFIACSAKVEKPAPDSTPLASFEAKAIGEEGFVSSEDIEGLSLIFVVSDFCGPCHLELQRMAELKDEYSKLNLYLGIVGKGDESLKRADSLGLSVSTFEVDSVLVQTLHIRSIPQRILVADGNEIMRIVGASSSRDSEMTETIDNILGIVRDTLSNSDTIEGGQN